MKIVFSFFVLSSLKRNTSDLLPKPTEIFNLYRLLPSIFTAFWNCFGKFVFIRKINKADYRLFHILLVQIADFNPS